MSAHHCIIIDNKLLILQINLYLLNFVSLLHYILYFDLYQQFFIYFIKFLGLTNYQL